MTIERYWPTALARENSHAFALSLVSLATLALAPTLFFLSFIHIRREAAVYLLLAMTFTGISSALDYRASACCFIGTLGR